MTVLQAYDVVLQTGLLFVILPQVNLGFSDYKICGDSECESPMSRVQAIRDHRGTDCRFLSFKQGDVIFVYHKLTGKREDLWAGSIDKQFGYFPKDAVREEHIHATTEVVVSTQESDFFCMDEFGHLLDSSHLDSAGGDQKVHNQDTKTPESLSKFVSADSPASAQSLSTLAEKDGSTYADAQTAAQTQKEPRNVQGGSSSDSWLGSSVTGWFGLTAKEKSDNMDEGEEQDEIQAEASLTSTVTGWLGLGDQQKPDDALKATDGVSVNADSLASTMTGWLGFGGKEKTDPMSEREQEVEKASGLEPEEKYRSRRMSMNLEDTDEEREETSTLEWLGNGLSKTFSLSLSNQESEHEESTQRDTKQTTLEEEQPSSWFDMGIGDMLGFKKGKIDVDGSTGSESKRTEKPAEQGTGSENTNSGQSQPAMTEEVMTETYSLSEVVEVQKDESDPPERKVSPGSVDSVTDDMYQGSNPKRIFSVDGEQSAEMESKEHQISNSSEEIKRKPEEENASGDNQSFMTQNIAATHISQEHPDCPRPPTGEDGKRNSKEKADIPDFKDNTDTFLRSRASPDGEDGGHDAERALPENAHPAIQGQASEGVNDDIPYSLITQPVLSSDSAGEYKEQVSSDNDNFTNKITGVDHFNSLVVPDKVPDAEDIAELVQSPHSEDGSIRNMSADVSEDDIGKTTQVTSDDDSTAGQKSETDADADIIQENDAGDDVLEETALETAADPETGQLEKHKITEEEEVEPPDNQLAANEVEPEEETAMENGTEGEETQGEEDEIDKDKVEGVQAAQKQIAELTLEVEKVKKGEKQQQEFSTKDKKTEDQVQESKDDLKKEEEALAEEKRVGDRQSSLHFKADMETILQTEIQSEGSSGTFTQTETLQDEEGDSDRGGKVKKMKDGNPQENVMDEQRDVPESVKHHCSEAPANSLVGDREGSSLETEWSSTQREDTQAGEQHLPTGRDPDVAERTEENDSGSMEKEESRKQEEGDHLDSAANEESTGNESDEADGMKDISDSSKYLQNSSVTEDDLFSTGGENTSLTEDRRLHLEEKNKSGVEMVTNITSDDHNVDGAENSGTAEELRTRDDDTPRPNPGPEVRTESSGSQHPTSSLRSDGKNKAEDESGAGFSFLNGAFGYFSQTSAARLVQNLDSVAGEGQGSLTPEPELDFTTVYDQGGLTAPSITPPQPSALQSQPSPPPPPPPIQPASPLHPHLHQTKSLSKQYKSLLPHMSVDEIAILLEHFGRHKLQFLDYICGISQPPTEELDHDESILLDVERLLHYHLEATRAPRTGLTDPPQEEKEKSPTLIALDKLQMLVTRIKEMFNRRKLDTRSTYHQAEGSCDDEFCSAHTERQDVAPEREPKTMGESSEWLDSKAPKEDWTGVDEGEDGQPIRDIKEKVTVDGKSVGGVMKQIRTLIEDATTHARATRELLIFLIVQVVSALPDDIRPGPDLYGLPWEPVIFSGLVGLMTVLLFTCRCYSSIKSRMYRSKERWMAEQVAQMLNEKCKVLETLSKCQQEHEDLESSLRDSGVLAQTQKTKDLEGEIAMLGHAKKELKRDLEQLKDQLEQQREYGREQERRIAVLEESMKTLDEETKDLQVQHEQAQTTLKVYNMNSDRLQRNLETAREENTLLQESNAQLGQQMEGWAERVSELDEEMSRCEVAHGMMQQDVANRDECIMSLTDQLLRIKAWDSDLEEEPSNGSTERGAKSGRDDKADKQGHLQKVQKLIYAAKLNADLKSMDEDKDRVFAKLNDEVKAKEDLLVSITEMENEKSCLQSDTESYSSQVQRLQQKLQIMTEMYQENELKLHRMLTVEEKERLQKEEKLNKADRNIALAMEELNNYRQRAAEMEEELEKTKQSYQTQISAHEKKAHNNWLAARAADRELADIRRENALLRQKMTDTQFKIDALDKDPFALDNLARPLPFRAERPMYGPSPLGRPGSESRPFLSPPTLVDGPPAARLSPRAPRGPGELLGGQGEPERSGGPHSDSGSNSPTWDRDRRGPPAGPPPPGYQFPEPGGPMFRRPPPPPGALGFLPPPGSLPPPGPLHPRNLPSDGPFRDGGLGPEQLHRESGDGRTPPDAEPRVGGAPPPGPLMDGPPPRRGPYGPPPPDFYPPRGPMMPMWAPPPPGVIFPPRLPPGGPSFPPPPPHLASSVRQPPASIRGPTPSSAEPPFPTTQPGATGAHTPT